MDENLIRYRAKIQGTDAWIYGIPARVYKDNYIDSIIDDKGNTEYIKTDTLSRIVGLTDINKKDIYFGDIVALDQNVYKDEYFEVTFNKIGVPIFKNNNKVILFSNYFISFGNNNLEIIGNTIDNKELLNKGL